MTSMPRVRAGLLTHKLDDQVLVYDPKADRVHLLDATTARVLSLLQETGWTFEGMSIEVSERFGTEESGSLVSLAIEALRAADLLEAESAPSAMVDVARRDMIRKVAAVATAALLVPAISTFTATPGYAATGAGLVAHCGVCTSSAQCQNSETCNNKGACGGNSGDNPSGASCTQGQQCCSGTCTGGHCA